MHRFAVLIMSRSRWSLLLVAAIAASGCVSFGPQIPDPTGPACAGSPATCRQIDLAVKQLAELPSDKCGFQGHDAQCIGPPRPNDVDPAFVSAEQAAKGLLLIYKRYPGLYCRTTCKPGALNASCMRECLELRSTP